MFKTNLIILVIAILSLNACKGQSTVKYINKKTKSTNPLLCDIEKGLCETPEEETTNSAAKNTPIVENQ